MTRNLDIVDLDQTLVRLNTFPRWVNHVFWSSLMSRRPGIAAQVAVWTVLRKLRLLSHDRFKSKIISLPVGGAAVSRFVPHLTAFVDTALLANLRSRPTTKIVASGAPEIYLGPLVEALGLEVAAVLGSSVSKDGHHNSNLGPAKAEGVSSWMQAQYPPYASTTLYTDHADDLPLAQLADHIVLCNPDDAALAAFQGSGADVETWRSAAPKVSRRDFLDLSHSSDLHAASTRLAEVVAEDGFQPDLIVGIARGGVPIAATCADLLGCPMTSVRRSRALTAPKEHLFSKVLAALPSVITWRLRSLESDIRELNHRYRADPQDPRIPVTGLDLPGSVAPNIERVLIIDDAVDTGTTMLEVIECISRAVPAADIRSAALTVTFRKPTYLPNYVLFRGTLVRGPWSTDSGIS